MKLPPLNALRVFLVAAEARSFTLAASRLCLTQGAVSRQIQQLEGFYATPLFLRLSRGLALTAEGEALLEPVRDAFARIHVASEMLRQRQSDLRVRSSATPAMRWLLPNLPEFQRLYPEYNVHLVTQLSHELPFNRAEYDLAIIGLKKTELLPGYCCECIAHEQLVMVCAPALAARLPLATPDDLAHFTLLHPWRGENVWARYLAQAGATKVNAADGLTFDTLEYALAAAVGGMGVTLAQRSMVEADIACGRLFIPFDTTLETEWAYYLVYPQAAATQPKIIAFRDWLLAVLGEKERRG